MSILDQFSIVLAYQSTRLQWSSSNIQHLSRIFVDNEAVLSCIIWFNLQQLHVVLMLFLYTWYDQSWLSRSPWCLGVHTMIFPSFCCILA
jgi:hypothetical protein